MIKPKVFVSSTVLDFEDLRSSLKYYLMDFGYDVQMSEYPDFTVNPDDTVFDACIKNLEKCQYFILLIGYRRGNWFTKDKYSITHKEYLTAKSLIEEGHELRIITFIRKPIWLLRNDRESLVSHFKEKSIEFSEQLYKAGTSVIDDPEYIFNFINDVSKGIKFAGSESPANNWIYDFTSFEDIITALKHTFKITESLDDKRLRKLFLRELEQNRRRFLIPKEGIKLEDYDDPSKIPQDNFLEIIAIKYGSRMINNDGKSLIGLDNIEIAGSEIGDIFFYTVMILIQSGLKNLNTKILERIINEGVYLIYSTDTHDYSSNRLIYALEKLHEWITNLKEFFETDVYRRFSVEMSQLSTDGSSHLPTVMLPLNLAGTLLFLSQNSRIKDLIDCIFELLDNSNIEPLTKFDFSDVFLTRYK